MNVVLIVVCVVVVIVFIAALSKSDEDDKPVSTGYNTSSSRSYVSYEKPANYQRSDDDSLTIVGGFYREWEARDYIEGLQPYDEVFFLAEPDNEYDKNAVMVISVTGLHLGYVPRSLAKSFKYKLAEKKLKGLVLGFPDNYQFNVKVLPVTIDTQKYQFYSDLMSQAVNRYKRKQYSQVLEALKPMIDEGIKGYEFLRLMIYTYHCMGDYKNESIYLDKILSLDKIQNKEYFDRRKYHVLRVLGYIISDLQIENVKAGVETTVLELDYFNRIVSLLSDVVDPNRIDFRDSKGLFAVNLDNNIRRPICKLYLNNPEKMFIGLMNEDNSILKIPISSIDELDGVKDELIAPIKKYINDSSLFM